jgi:hypothetical protein
VMQSISVTNRVKLVLVYLMTRDLLRLR